MEKKKFYISGQMTGLSKKEYSKNFRDAEAHLKECGFDVINPSKICDNKYITYGELLWVDLKNILDCDAIYMLSNWTNSKGSKVEYAFADAIGLEIVFQEDLAENKQ